MPAARHTWRGHHTQWNFKMSLPIQMVRRAPQGVESNGSLPYDAAVR